MVPNHALYQAKLRPELSGIITTIRLVVHLAVDRSVRVSQLGPQIRREPFFHCGYGFASPGRVINCLIASDLPYAEIFRIRMRKIESAHAGAGMHRKRLRQFDPCVVLCIEQIKDRSFLGVIGTGWLTGGGTDAAIFFTDQISIRQLFVAPKSPSDASFLMQIFSKGFS